MDEEVRRAEAREGERSDAEHSLPSVPACVQPPSPPSKRPDVWDPRSVWHRPMPHTGTSGPAHSALRAWASVSMSARSTSKDAERAGTMHVVRSALILIHADNSQALGCTAELTMSIAAALTLLHFLRSPDPPLTSSASLSPPLSDSVSSAASSSDSSCPSSKPSGSLSSFAQSSSSSL